MDNVSVRYVPLATLSVRQAFYANGVARKSSGEPDLDFAIEPTAECEETMRRLDILFRTCENHIAHPRALGSEIILPDEKGAQRPGHERR